MSNDRAREATKQLVERVMFDELLEQARQLRQDNERLTKENEELLKERNEARRDHCSILLLEPGGGYATAHEIAVRYYGTDQADLLFPPKEDKI